MLLLNLTRLTTSTSNDDTIVRPFSVPSGEPLIDQLDDYQRPYRALEILQKKKIIPRENALLRKVSSNRETKKLELISTGSLSQISM